MRRILLAAVAAASIGQSKAAAVNFRIDCDQSTSTFTLTDYWGPGNLQSFLHTPEGQVISGTTDGGAYGGFADPYERYVWTARFNNGATLRLNWAIRIDPKTGYLAFLPDAIQAAFIGSQVTMTLWNERGEVANRASNCAFTKMW